jgi:hypothetical protein
MLTLTELQHAIVRWHKSVIEYNKAGERYQRFKEDLLKGVVEDTDENYQIKFSLYAQWNNSGEDMRKLADKLHHEAELVIAAGDCNIS